MTPGMERRPGDQSEASQNNSTTAASVHRGSDPAEDRRRSIAVDPVALGGGWHVAMCVNPDGSTWPWLIAPGDEDNGGCSCRDCAPHERLGALPREYRPKCRGVRKDGQPCRGMVSRAGGEYCTAHADQAVDS